MYLITFTFEIDDDDCRTFMEEYEGLKSFWETHGFETELYRDPSRQTRFMQTFLTDQPVDALTALIQTDPGIRAFFDRVKESGNRLLVSMMERVDETHRA